MLDKKTLGYNIIVTILIVVNQTEVIVHLIIQKTIDYDETEAAVHEVEHQIEVYNRNVKANPLSHD